MSDPAKKPSGEAVDRRDFPVGGATAMTAVAVAMAGATPTLVESFLRKAVCVVGSTVIGAEQCVVDTRSRRPGGGTHVVAVLDP